MESAITSIWADSGKKKILDDCMKGASESLGEAKAESYCNCLLKKIMEASPNPANVAQLDKGKITKWAINCQR